MEPSKEMEDREKEEESVQEKGKGGDDGLRSQLPELVCVEYPGIVANPEKMIGTLGGLETLAQVLSRLSFSSGSWADPGYGRTQQAARAEIQARGCLLQASLWREAPFFFPLTQVCSMCETASPCPLGFLSVFLFQTTLSRVKKRKLKAGREGGGKPAFKFETSIEGVVPTTYRWVHNHLK